MCHQALQGTQCTGARLYLWPVVQTKRKVTPLVSAAVNASPGEQMGVCSPSGPHPAVLHAPTALGGARGDVCVAALSGGTVKLYAVVSSASKQTPPHPTPNKQTSMPNCGNSGALMRHSSEICQQLGSWLAVWEIFWHPHRPAARCKVVACLPGPALGSANPPCVSQIPSVFVRQQRGHLLMTFHVFTGVLLRVGWGVGVGGGKVGK